MNLNFEEFDFLISKTEKQLKAIPEQNINNKPAPEKWSQKEILGHLIDSAFNNHRRFILGQFKNNLVFNGYDQNRWVDVQGYNQLPWFDLIDLWQILNNHILHTISMIPAEKLNQQQTEHNLDQISWQKIEKEKPATLEYLINDYYGHLQHHLRQIYEI